MQSLIGIGTDCASANIAAAGLKDLVDAQLVWVFWTWCVAHRQELAVKDALRGTLFNQVDEMLTRLYYIYEKSPKKCRELEKSSLIYVSVLTSMMQELGHCMPVDRGG